METWNICDRQQFYDNSILSGTKIACADLSCFQWFYDNSILSGTKIVCIFLKPCYKFYDNSILSGTKIEVKSSIEDFQFYDNSILSGTKISNSNIIVIKFTIIIFLYHFYLLKRYYYTIFSL